MKSLFIICMLLVGKLYAQPYAWLLTGIYDSGKSKGIFAYKFNYKTGEAVPVYNANDVSNASYLTITKNGKNVYALSEEAGVKQGRVAAYSFNKATGALTKINDAAVKGDHPCYVAISNNEAFITTANYTGGSLSYLKINKNKSVNNATQVIQHTGSSINAKRQTAPHVHTTMFDTDGDLWVADLGTDAVTIYAQAADSLQYKASIQLTPGSGPRHIEFNKKYKHAYIINELSATISVIDYNNLNALHIIQTLPLLQTKNSDDEGSADIHLLPNGKFLYASTRGITNAIAIIKIADDGKLSYVSSQKTMGIKPRNFYIDKTGTYLFAANQSSNSIVIFKINATTGLLTDTNKRINIAKPVCVKMIY